MSPRLVVVAVVLLVTARTALAGLADVAPDEAYYWVWSRQLSLTYFDHPPLLAWLLAWTPAGLPLTLRLVPILASVAVVALMFDGLRRRGPDTAPYWACMLLATPAIAIGGLLATPDALLLLGIAFVVRQLLVFESRQTAPDMGSPWVFLVEGLASVGGGLLVCVLAKLTGWVILATVLVLAIVGPSFWHTRVRLIALGGVLFAASVASPVYLLGLSRGDIWAHQLGRIDDVAWQGWSPVLLVAGAVGLVGPWFAMAMLRGVVGRSDPTWLALSAPFLALVPLSAVVDVELNWLLPALLPLVVLAARSGETCPTASRHGQMSRQVWWGTMAWGCGVLATTMVLVVSATTTEPLTRVFGWKSWAIAVDRVVADRGVPVTERYQEASIVWYWTGRATTTIECVPDWSGHAPRTSHYGRTACGPLAVGQPFVISTRRWEFLSPDATAAVFDGEVGGRRLVILEVPETVSQTAQ